MTTAEAGIGLGRWTRSLGLDVELGMDIPEGRTIPECGDNYVVTPDGQLWSRPRPGARGGYRKLQKGKDDYPIIVVKLSNGRTVTYAFAPLVARLYLGPKPDGLEVRHLNGDKDDNRWTNLAYGTHAENMRDKIAHGTNHNINKTHCPQGHPYDKANTYRRKDRPGRECKACRDPLR